MGTGWRGSRVGLAAVGLALLAGTPAVLTAAKVSDPWILAAATAAAAVIVVFGAVWQQRLQRQAQRHDEQDFSVEDGCLVLADGRLPLVSQISDPVQLGVHRAQPVARPAAGHVLPAGAPAYVARDVDDKLRERLAKGGFVLLIGDSTAGKSRAAFEATRATLADHVLIRPANREAVTAAVGRAARERRCVLWLDDLETYLGIGGLTTAHCGRLLTGDGHHRVILATIRTAELDRLTSQADDDAGRLAAGDVRQLLDQAGQLRISRMFTSTELDRARTRNWDPRVADALRRAGDYGIAEYLAAGPALLGIWENARASSQGPHARGAALVAAAIDVRRAGWTSPLPRDLLSEICDDYMTGAEHAHTPREPLDQAWDWATQQRNATSALLRPVPGSAGAVEAFDYLVDTIQRREGPLARVREPTIRAAITYASPVDANSLAEVAYLQSRYILAVQAWRSACRAQARDPALGIDHRETLISRGNLATALLRLGRLDEAEAEQRAVLHVRVRVLGADDPATLTSRSNLATVLRLLGRLEEAEVEQRAVLQAFTRVLGADHRLTLTGRGNLATILRRLGRLQEAEVEHRAVLQSCTRVLGADDTATLTSRSNLAAVLRLLGRLEEAEAEHRAALQASTRVLGADHPATLTSRGNHALALGELARLEEAEAEHRAVLQARTRVLGTDHPATLTSRSNLATVLRLQGRLEEAEAEHRAVLQARTRVLGADHPDTLTSRSNLAIVSRRLGRLETAEAEQRAVLQAFTRVLGADHPYTLTGRNNLATALRLLGRLEEAEAEHRAVLQARTRILGADHPATLTSRSNHALALGNLGRLEEAEAEQRAVLEARTRVLGADHPDTLTSSGNLAIVLRRLRRLEETEAKHRAVRLSRGGGAGQNN
jgi:tetratricopeptide (TPR) repeat protein